MSNDGNFRRRTAMTMFKDALKHAERSYEVSKTEFWRHEIDAMKWVIKQLRTRRLGSTR